MGKLTPQEALVQVKRVAPRFGHDTTHQPMFVPGCDRVCIVRHTVEDPGGLGYDIAYVVWKSPKGEVCSQQIKNTAATTRNFLSVTLMLVCLDGRLFVDFGREGRYVGMPWDPEMVASLKAEAR